MHIWGLALYVQEACCTSKGWLSISKMPSARSGAFSVRAGSLLYVKGVFKTAPLDVQMALCTIRPALLDVQRALCTFALKHVLPCLFLA
jgi:hypothetical protein